MGTFSEKTEGKHKVFSDRDHCVGAQKRARRTAATQLTKIHAF